MIYSVYLAGGFSVDYRRKVMKHFRRMVREVEFDTIVVTGTSGLLMGPMLAQVGRKNLLVARKSSDDGHSCVRLEGWRAGQRLVFVDDFVESGATAERVNSQLSNCPEMKDWKWAGVFLWQCTEYDDRWVYQERAPWLKTVPLYRVFGYVNRKTAEVTDVTEAVNVPKRLDP